ncbi:DUF2304 domain-containing protein [Nocardioides zeicaulis]|uniref:DUF2304 domain-containing protein n=1 Tax=Nocardioides zeicaulis TaxID=1776857 RepID=A0ABV6DY00_9ACTN
MSSTFTLGLIGGVLTLVVIFEMLRRQRLREKYAVIWVVVVVATVLLAVFPQMLTASADVLGVEVPANLLFFGAIMLLLFISIQLSYEIGRLEERTRTLAEEIALIRLQVEQRPGRGTATGEGPTTPAERASDDPRTPPEVG